MGWLIGPTLFSLLLAFLAVKLFEYVFPGVMGWLGSVARFGVFIITWTTVTVVAGMHGFTGKVRQLRQAIGEGK